MTVSNLCNVLALLLLLSGTLQVAAYSRALASPDFQALILAKEDCDCGSGEPRAACCHQ